MAFLSEDVLCYGYFRGGGWVRDSSMGKILQEGKTNISSVSQNCSLKFPVKKT